MPLERRCSTKAMGRNVAREIKAGKDKSQASAIGYSTLKKACGVTTDKKLTPKEIVARKRKSESSELTNFKTLLNDCCSMLGVKSKLSEADSKLVDAIMSFEDGSLGDEKTLELFSELIKTGMVNHLQGFYGRTAAEMMKQGYLDRSGKILKHAEAQTVGLGEAEDANLDYDEFVGMHHHVLGVELAADTKGDWERYQKWHKETGKSMKMWFGLEKDPDMMTEAEESSEPKAGSRSPWGKIQDVNVLAPGIVSVETAGHGGTWLSPERRKALNWKKNFNNSATWWEEDSDWAVPFYFFREDIKAYNSAYPDMERNIQAAIDTIKSYHKEFAEREKLVDVAKVTEGQEMTEAAEKTRTVSKTRLMAWDESEESEDRIKDVLDNIADHDYIWDNDHELMTLWESPEVNKDGKKFVTAMKKAKLYDSFEKQVRDSVYGDSDWFQDSYQSMTEQLAEVMKKKNPDGYWRGQVKNFGWRAVSGEKYFQANTGQELLDEVLPKTDCTFYIYDFGKDGLAINNYHHDSPTGKEWYYLIPVTAAEFENKGPVSQAMTVNTNIDNGDFFTGFHSAAGPTTGTQDEIRKFVVKAFEKESGGKAHDIKAEPMTEGDEYENVSFTIKFADKSELDVTLNIFLTPKDGRFESRNAEIAATELRDAKAVTEEKLQEESEYSVIDNDGTYQNARIHTVSRLNGIDPHAPGAYDEMEIVHDNIKSMLRYLEAMSGVHEEADSMSPAGIRKAMTGVLSSMGLSNKFKVKNVGFSDLARGSSYYVTIQDWKPEVGKAEAVKDKMKQLYPKGVIVSFSGPGIA